MHADPTIAQPTGADALNCGRKLATNCREWQYLTGRDFAEMDRARTVVMLACSPLEVHGPHLPVITDNLEAEALSARCMELLTERHPEMQFLHMPPIYVAADVVPHPGSVMFRSSTITRVLSDLGRSLGKQGFKHIWIGSFHGGPRHFVPIEVACHRSNRRYGTRMVSVFSLMVKRLTGGSAELSQVLGHLPGVTPEELQGDHHGGAIETSMMLHLVGRHVDQSFRGLPQSTVDLKLAREGRPPLRQGGIRDLVRAFKHRLKYYEEITYAGKPSIASPEIGQQMLDILAGYATDALSDLWTGKLAPEECHSPLWPIRWVFTSEALGWAFEKALRYRTQVF